MSRFLFLAVVCICVFGVDSSRFLRGRPKGGLLPSPPLPKGHTKPEDNWFTQRLDHFDDSNRKTWKQRYFFNDTFRKKEDSPVFLMIGGEGTANSVWLVVGNMMNYAKEFGAFTIMLEHRFYGESHPTSDLSDDSLKYLNSEQALADLAGFRQAMAVKFNLTKSKWISFGGSYPGSLSAWYRLKYPHLVDGAVATSAPVLAQLDFPEYLEVVAASLDTTGSGCNKNIANATQKIDSLLQTPEGIAQLVQKFRICVPLDINNINDVSVFTSELAGNFFGVVQYNKDNRAFEGVPGTSITIDTLCSIMTNEGLGDPLTRYAKVNSLMLDTYGEKCLDVSYGTFVDSLRNTSWDSSSAEGGRQWYYQTCTEFGFYQTTDTSKQPFGSRFPLSYSIQQCEDVFGRSFNKTNIQSGVKQTNTNYGGKDIASSKIVFPNGSIDPWHALGIIYNISDTEQAIFIKGTAHCANMYPESPDDLPQLKDARERIKQHIMKWLSE